MKTVTVVINGIPECVASSDVALNLNKILGARVESFQIRDLRNIRSISNWQFALDFNSLYEALTAQTLLHCHDYVLSNGKLCMLYAEISGDPKVMKSVVSVVSSARSRNNSYEEDSAILGLVPKVCDEELYRRCSRMDAQIQYFNKLKTLVKAEYEYLREKRRLRSEYERMNEMEESRRLRSPRYYRSRSRQRSRSRSRRTTRSSRRDSRYRDETNNIQTPSTSTNSNQSSFAASNHMSFGMVFHQSQNRCTSENSFDNTTSGYHIDININSEINNEMKTNNLKPKVFKMRMEKRDATKCILKELDSMLDKICHEKNVNILEKGVNLNIIRKAKDVVKHRLDSLKITKDMACGAIVSCYRRIFSKNDDRKLIETFLNEYIVANPQKQNKSDSASVSSSEPYFNMCNDEDNKMWRDVEDILQDVKIETLSAEDEDDTINIKNLSKSENLDELTVKEEVDLTHEPIVMAENNTQLELIVVSKTNGRHIVHSDENIQVICQKEISTNVSQQSAVNDIKLINRKPTFFIATKSLMRKLKSVITEISPVNVQRFTAVVKKDIRNKIIMLLKGREYMKTTNIVKLFWEHYPKENYKQFLKRIADDLKN